VVLIMGAVTVPCAVDLSPDPDDAEMAEIRRVPSETHWEALTSVEFPAGYSPENRKPSTARDTNDLIQFSGCCPCELLKLRDCSG
jgi:hypothetical protein